MAKYKEEKAGPDGWSDWIRPLPGYKNACCDCGLVHNFEFRLDDLNQLNFRVSRNVRATAAMRRGKPTVAELEKKLKWQIECQDRQAMTIGGLMIAAKEGLA